MEKVNLHKKDVEAIAANRNFGTKKERRMMFFLGITICVVVLIGFVIWVLDRTSLAGVYLSGAAAFVGFLAFVFDSRREYKHRKAFIDHWEKTGEIPPREGK